MQENQHSKNSLPRKLSDVYPGKYLFGILFTLPVLFLFAYFFPFFVAFSRIALLAFAGLLLAELLILFSLRNGIQLSRDLADRFSNGDPNPVTIKISSLYALPINVLVYDEIPNQFQLRDNQFSLALKAAGSRQILYYLRPVKRGEYHFGKVLVYVRTPLNLLSRRYRFGHEKMVKVYPSFIQMRKFELIALGNSLRDQGIKKIRRIGHTMEFEQIKEYVPGDQYRSINWKATARKGNIMVNQFQDERAQRIYCVIDKGRNMKFPFEELRLIDYSVNAALVMSNIAMLKYDKAGIITFSNKIGNTLPADRKPGHLNKVMDVLYNQRTSFPESDFERLYVHITRALSQRSMLFLFTHFETVAAMRRQLPYLRRLARSHLLVVIFFENTELRTVIDQRPKKLEEIYLKTIAEKFGYEQKLIARELKMHGIYTVYTPPQDLSINALNKYLEIKARGLG